MAPTLSVFTYVAAFILLQSTNSAVASIFHRRILHHPLFPLDTPAPTQPPNSSPHPPKSNATNHHSPPSPSAHPLSSTPGGGGPAPSAATTTADPQNPFFPTYPSLSPPPPPPAASSSSAGEGSIPTFPANISSLVVPHSRSSSSAHSATSPKLIAVTVVLCLVAVALLASFFVLRRHRNRRDRRPLRHAFKQPPPPSEQTPHSDNAVLYPPYSATSDGRPPKLPVRAGVSTTSSEFLYIGTLTASNSTEFEPPHHENQIESPEIRPLPPLEPLHKHKHLRNSDSDATDDDEFYSPANSSGRIENFRSSSTRRTSEALARIEAFQTESKISKFPSYPDSSSSSPANSAHSGPSVLVNSASDSSNSCSPEYIMRPPPLIHRVPPPPPPPPPPATARVAFAEPPILPQPSRSVKGFKSGEQQQNSQAQSWNRDGNERNDEIRKPKLKGLHWDKVRASSDRVTVWDQLEAGSFALNEEMMETLFTANTANMGAKVVPQRSTMPMMNQEYRVLDPKKSQNIAILLRALNVTVEEVCDSLLEGNADMLGTELLESLLKMTPTEEEERKLREYKDESPQKLGPAERFLKAVLDIPFAFKRVDAMLYIANFDSEVEYLKRSYEALEVACDELRNSRMFLKLLEAVLKTGNRMNVGTNRGDAQAFKLDTLLKLVDVKGTDGKTTLLHFVVQEIIKAQGTQTACSSSLPDDMETKKQGLQIVARLCGELTNVKKAAAMDSYVLANDVQKLVKGITKVEEVARLSNESQQIRFVDSMRVFLKKAGGEIDMIQSLESDSLLKVKELTEYFHGNSVMEEAHPLRIFTVVRDFLAILDKVCKEVAKVNERTMMSSNRNCVMPVNPNLPQLFPDHSNGERQDDERELLS